MSFFPTSAAFSALKNVAARLELSCHPLEGRALDFPEGDARPGTAVSRDLARLIEGGPESFEDREKWQLLSRELAQKKEIIHRMLRESDDRQ